MGKSVRILIIKLGALGDVVRSTAILSGLKRKYSECEIDWVTSESAFSLVNGLEDLANVYVIKSFPHNQKYDWVISLDDEQEACKLASNTNTLRLSGACWDEKEQSCKYTEDCEEWFGMGILRPSVQGGLDRANELKKSNTSSHPEIYYRMLKLNGGIGRPVVPITADHMNKAKNWLKLINPQIENWIGLNTGAGIRWKFKSWPKESTVELAQTLAKNANLGVLILGGKDEFERNSWIAAQANMENIFLAPTDWNLLEFASLISQCSLLFSSDSLALHLALATNIPVVSFFGPTSSSEIYLYENGEKVITPLNCRCCYLKDCEIRPNCMETITVNHMLRTADKYLKEII